MRREIHTDHVLECEQLSCPMPVVKTKKAMEEIMPGEILEVRATDKGSVADLQNWARRTGHQYIGLIEENGVFRHFLRKASLNETKAEVNFPHTMSNEELNQKLASGESIIVLDVREPAEYAFEHIPGAISVPLGQLEEKIPQLDPGKEYAVICRTGSRSDMACQILAEHCFSNVKNVLPGMSQWQGATESDE
ncbi:sulfurtransferase TusA family protein [Brevibacillus aydinogluensis]|uniref:Rhodanese domain-containing protein n=1 Tax=Brevibacillus aydinogluensis TaxID=927786 RepID=A0AA48RH06_9BACL|nr:sulfurtransferase TusA family protein [Brevibacillus aydinogluensis]CAJ1002269.1 Rhodanese domain-containing protein [Brevibacillus aydinogluensis]